jgi:hypothetical protein
MLSESSRSSQVLSVRVASLFGIGPNKKC